MEAYPIQNFGGVESEDSSVETLERWRMLSNSVVMNRKRRFRFSADLSKRDEAAAIKETDESNSHKVGTSSSIPGSPQGDAVIQTSLELDESNGDREERQRDLESEEEEERKGALEFSYFSTGIASAGIVGILSGFMGNQTGHTKSIGLKICNSFLMATFASGASIILLERLLRIKVSIRIIRYLKYATFGFLTLLIFTVFILFLKS